VIRLPSWSALPVIRQCISARVGYLARVSELEAYLPAFLAFDFKIDAAILSVAGVTPREIAFSFWLPTIQLPPVAAPQFRTPAANKVARYRPILGYLAADPDHLAIFLVEATGRLADPAMKLLKFIIQDSRPYLIIFVLRSEGYIAMAAHARLQYYLRSYHISVGE
jgi:hypothetical protein